MSESTDRGRRAAQQAAARHPAVTLIVLFGSRAREDTRSASDWDFAYEASGSVDPVRDREV
jgi:predicted nucleotidyltransferase